jgi:hypothetical protein
MASELRVNTLKDASGNNSVALSTVAEGSAKAACRINQSDGAGSFTHSFNTSSITDGGTGKHTITMTSGMSDANYAGSGCKGTTTYNYSLSITASNQFIMYVRNDSGTYADSSQVNGFAYGDLA